jgi:hypothetical protein
MRLSMLSADSRACDRNRKLSAWGAEPGIFPRPCAILVREGDEHARKPR